MSTHYDFARKAERILLVELSHRGAIRPLHIVDPANGSDALKVPAKTVAANRPTNFVVRAAVHPSDPTLNSRGLLALEYAGWRPGQNNYRSVSLQTVLNGTWVFGEGADQEYVMSGPMPAAVPLDHVNYRFERQGADKAELSWWSDALGSHERGSVTLSENLQYAYVALRLHGANEGEVEFATETFGDGMSRRFISAPAVEPAD